MLWCLLAPGWFASGVLAGPLCCLYLLWPQRPDEAGGRTGRWALTPLLGTLLFLAVSLPRTAAIINTLPHYQGPEIVPDAPNDTQVHTNG